MTKKYISNNKKVITSEGTKDWKNIFKKESESKYDLTEILEQYVEKKQVGGTIPQVTLRGEQVPLTSRPVKPTQGIAPVAGFGKGLQGLSKVGGWLKNFYMKPPAGYIANSAMRGKDLLHAAKIPATGLALGLATDLATDEVGVIDTKDWISKGRERGLQKETDRYLSKIQP